MPVISFVGLKGGTGKTTAAIGVACEFMRRGHSVLLVDSDPQQTACDWGKLAWEGGKPTPQITVFGDDMHRRHRLPIVSAGYDVTIIDTPPSVKTITRSALMVSDLAVMPCGPSTHETWAMAPTLELVGKAMKVSPSLQAHILISKKDPQTVAGKAARGILANTGASLLQTELSYLMDYQYASAAGLGPTTYSPSGRASLEIRNLVDELDALVTPYRVKEFYQ